MAETRLKVVLETTGQGKLKAARKDSDQLAKALGRVGVQSKSAANGIRLTGRAAAGATRGVKSLSSALGQVALAFGGIATAASLFNTAINREESERRIKLVASAYGEAAGLADAAGRAAKKFGISQTEANLAIADIRRVTPDDGRASWSDEQNCHRVRCARSGSASVSVAFSTRVHLRDQLRSRAD